MEKTETIVHIISHQDPQKYFELLEEFKKSRDVNDITIIESTTPIIINANGASIIIPSALIYWKCSKEQAVSFRNQQKLLIQKNGILS